MGFLDRILGTGRPDLTEMEGMAGIAICAVLADGRVHDAEARALTRALAEMRLFHEMNDIQLHSTVLRLLNLAEQKGPDRLMQDCARVLPPELKDAAFAVATDLLLSDGHVQDSEHAWLQDFQHVLGIPDAVAHRIVDVVGGRNRNGPAQ